MCGGRYLLELRFGSIRSRDLGHHNVNSGSGKHHTHLVTKTWLPDALLRSCPSPRARSRLPDALLWSLKFAENLSFRSVSVVSHLVTSLRLPDPEFTLSLPYLRVRVGLRARAFFFLGGESGSNIRTALSEACKHGILRSQMHRFSRCLCRLPLFCKATGQLLSHIHDNSRPRSVQAMGDFNTGDTTGSS